MVLDFGIISVRRLELTEIHWQLENTPLRPSRALSFLNKTSFPDTIELVLRYEPGDVGMTDTLRVAQIAQPRLSELTAQLEHVHFELEEWEYIEDLGLL